MVIGSMASSAYLLVLTCALWSPGGDVEARLREEYPRAAGELQELLSAFSAEGQFTRHYFSGNVLTVGVLRLAASNDRKVVIRDRKALETKHAKSDLNDDVDCLTGEYAFELRKASETGPHLILSYGPREEHETVEGRVNDIFSVTVLRMTHFNGRSFLSRLQSPQFVLKAAESTREGDTELVHIDFTWEDERGSESGSVLLEPARKWAIRRTNVIYTPKRTTSSSNEPANPGAPKKPLQLQTEVTYQDMENGKPFPIRTVSTVRLPDAPSRIQEERFEVTRVRLNEPPPEWFKLSGYGLPDVPLHPRPATSAFSVRNPWLWGSFATAVGCFALLCALRRRGAPSTA
jgi:hypothetical protein